MLLKHLGVAAAAALFVSAPALAQEYGPYGYGGMGGLGFDWDSGRHDISIDVTK